MLVVFVSLLVQRSDFEATVLRTRGTLFQEVEEGVYANIYDINLVNKTNRDLPVEIRFLEGEGTIRMIGDSMHLEKQGAAKSKFMILINRDQLTGRKSELTLGIYSGDQLIEQVETTFIAPIL